MGPRQRQSMSGRLVGWPRDGCSRRNASSACESCHGCPSQDPRLRCMQIPCACPDSYPTSPILLFFFPLSLLLPSTSQIESRPPLASASLGDLDDSTPQSIVPASLSTPSLTALSINHALLAPLPCHLLPSARTCRLPCVTAILFPVTPLCLRLVLGIMVSRKSLSCLPTLLWIPSTPPCTHIHQRQR